ncbi:facilitated trehalose transporter Tret1-2 homolog [Anoplophora glabripennis]|uniref:Facilitated trehalose transporter Tret1 n=1 Tax=Anoplophora glabripennis TaxID=217634 RepID=V5I8R9_ANOGL|nr:facilitated trehalose transporter Tret1-2 homolog [Anoplophora glabripennis]
MEGKKDEYKYDYAEGSEEAEPLATYDADRGNVNIVSPTMVSASSGTANRNFLYVAACAGNIASFICGTTIGWTSPEIPKLKGVIDNPLSSPITKTAEGWIGSLLPLGAAIGPFAAGIAADKIGRKKTLLISAIPFIITFVLNIVATHVYYFFASRFLCGLAVGIVFTVLPMYIGEIADDEVRGSLGSFMQLFIMLGLLFSYVLGSYLSVQTFNITLLIPPVVFLVVFLFFIPESPYYLVKARNFEGAEESLMKLRSKSKDDVQKELETTKGLVHEAQENKKNFFDIFKSRGLTMALFLSVSLVGIQQFSGINIVLFYAQDIFTDAGVSLAPEICTIILGIVQVFASSATPLLVERRGKRFLLLLSAAGMGLSQGVLAYFFYLKDDRHTDVSSIGWIPIVSLIVYIITYCLGFGPLPWAVMGELFPGNIKSAASTVTASGCWFLGFLLTNYFGIVADSIGKSGSFGIFSVCCLGAVVFTYKLLPETTGKSLQEIQDILNGNTPSGKE